jgi:hypothetical protein
MIRLAEEVYNATKYQGICPYIRFKERMSQMNSWLRGLLTGASSGKSGHYDLILCAQRDDGGIRAIIPPPMYQEMVRIAEQLEMDPEEILNRMMDIGRAAAALHDSESEVLAVVSKDDGRLVLKIDLFGEVT